MYIIELYRLVNGTLERMEEIIDYTGLQFYNKLNGTGGLQFYLNKDFNAEDYGLSMLTFDFSLGKSF